TAPAPIKTLSLTHASVVYSYGPLANGCHQVELWNTDLKVSWRFGDPGPCEQTSTGSGIADVSVAGLRVLWVAYAGGNLRDGSPFSPTTCRRGRLQTCSSARFTSSRAPESSSTSSI